MRATTDSWYRVISSKKDFKEEEIIARLSIDCVCIELKSRRLGVGPRIDIHSFFYPLLQHASSPSRLLPCFFFFFFLRFFLFLLEIREGRASARPISRPIFLFKVLSCSLYRPPYFNPSTGDPLSSLPPPAPRTVLLPSLRADRSISPLRRRGKQGEWNEFERPSSSRAAIPPSNEVEFRF